MYWSVHAFRKLHVHVHVCNVPLNSAIKFWLHFHSEIHWHGNGRNVVKKILWKRIFFFFFFFHLHNIFISSLDCIFLPDPSNCKHLCLVQVSKFLFVCLNVSHTLLSLLFFKVNWWSLHKCRMCIYMYKSMEISKQYVDIPLINTVPQKTRRRKKTPQTTTPPPQKKKKINQRRTRNVQY